MFRPGGVRGRRLGAARRGGVALRGAGGPDDAGPPLPQHHPGALRASPHRLADRPLWTQPRVGRPLRPGAVFLLNYELRRKHDN